MGQQACCCVHQECGVPCCELAKRYKQHAPKSVYRHATERTTMVGPRSQNIKEQTITVTRNILFYKPKKLKVSC